jgi:hypothetical protein
MRQLDIVHDQLEYVGLLSAPAFRLFSNPGALASGMYYAFQGYHSGTDDITFEGEPAQPLRQSCAVDLGSHGTYTVSLERVEWTRPDSWAWELDSSVLAQGDRWLRSLRADGGLMHSHYFTYTAHASSPSGTARDLLLAMGGPSLPGFGESDGTGLIFHSRTAPGDYPVQFTINHSHEVEDGLFIELVAILETDTIDYLKIGPWLLGLLRRAVGGVGLEIVTGVG